MAYRTDEIIKIFFFKSIRIVRQRYIIERQFYCVVALLASTNYCCHFRNSRNFQIPTRNFSFVITVTREKTIIRCATPEQNVFSSFGYSFRGTEWQIGAWRTMLGWFLCNDRRTHHRRAENEVGKASVLKYFEYFVLLFFSRIFAIIISTIFNEFSELYTLQSLKFIETKFTLPSNYYWRKHYIIFSCCIILFPVKVYKKSLEIFVVKTKLELWQKVFKFSHIFSVLHINLM